MRAKFSFVCFRMDGPQRQREESALRRRDERTFVPLPMGRAVAEAVKRALGAS